MEELLLSSRPVMILFTTTQTQIIPSHYHMMFRAGLLLNLSSAISLLSPAIFNHPTNQLPLNPYLRSLESEKPV